MEPTFRIERKSKVYNALVMPLYYAGLVLVLRVERRLNAHQANVLPLDDTSMVGRGGLEPPITRFQSEALATRLPPEDGNRAGN